MISSLIICCHLFTICSSICLQELVAMARLVQADGHDQVAHEYMLNNKRTNKKEGQKRARGHDQVDIDHHFIIIMTTPHNEYPSQ